MLSCTPKRMFERHGAAYTLQKRAQAAGANAWTSGGVTSTFHPCVAVQASDVARTAKGSVQETGRVVLIDDTGLTVEPAQGDRIAFGTYLDALPGIEWMQLTQKPERISYLDAVVMWKCRVSE